MQLLQIPFSHNCIKVRRALELKNLAYETLDIRPQDRRPVVSASGQPRVPVLVDRGVAMADSTRILRHLEAAYPEPALLPADPALHADCWLLEDWADQAFMERTRRMAYWHRLHRSPEVLAERFFPGSRGPGLWVRMQVLRILLGRRFGLSAARNRDDEEELPRLARLAVDRLDGLPYLFGDGITVADLGLAAMAAPAHLAAPSVREEAAVRELLRWSGTILGPDVMRIYAAPAPVQREPR